jgi:NADPH2:quinone reductase
LTAQSTGNTVPTHGRRRLKFLLARSLKAGETLLLHGATSGIGVNAIQMATAAGARVIATGRGADKASAAKALGADVVLDMVGGDYVARNLDALTTGGRIVFIASLGGGQFDIPIFRIMQKRAVITGSTLRPRDADEKARLAAAIERVVWPSIAAGKVKA